MDIADEDIEAEIRTELELVNVDDLDLNSSVTESSEDDGITKVTEDILTEQSSSDNDTKNQSGEKIQVSPVDTTADEREFLAKLSAVNEVANQLRADLDDCNKLLQDADLRIDGLKKSEHSQEIEDVAQKQGKTVDDLKSEILRDVEKLEEDLEKEAIKETQSASNVQDVSLGYFEANTMVLVPSKKFPRSARMTTGNVLSTPSTTRPESDLSTGRLTSLAVEWDQYVTEIEADMNTEADLDPAAIEKEALLRLVQLHKSQKETQKGRAERLMKYKSKMNELSLKHEQRMEEKKKHLAEEEAGLEKAKLNLLENVQDEEKQMQASILDLEDRHQRYMQKKIAAMLEEQERLKKQKMLLQEEIDKKRNWAATKIQKCYRGALSRRKYRLLVKLRKKRMEEWRAMRDADAIAEIAHRNREAKTKTEEEKRAKEVAAAKKAEKNRRENEEMKAKIQAAEKEKREKIKEEKLKKLTNLNEKEKVELASQESEIIEKLRTEEKTLVEKKVDKLIQQKKQKKFGGKQDKVKKEDANCELNGDTIINSKVTVNGDSFCTQQSATLDIPTTESTFNEKDNHISKSTSEGTQSMVSELKNDEDKVSRDKNGTSNSVVDSMEAATKVMNAGKLSREATVKIDFVDLNKELNNLMQFPSFEQFSNQHFFENSRSNAVGSNEGPPSQGHPLDESLFTNPAKVSNLSELDKKLDKTFMVSDHEINHQESYYSNVDPQNSIPEAGGDLPMNDSSSHLDDWPNRKCYGMVNISDKTCDESRSADPTDEFISENQIKVDDKTEEENGESVDVFETAEETESFIDAVAEANLSLDVDVTATSSHQMGLESIRENTYEEADPEQTKTTTDSLSTCKLDSVLDNRRIQWMTDCIPWSKIKSVQKQGQVGGKPRLPIRSAAAKRLAKIPESVILSSSVGQATALKNVQTVVLEDLPGYNLEPLGDCPNLEYLVLDSCNILSLEGISNCSKLKLVHARHNKLESLNLGNLEDLIELDVSSNRISSLAGLDGCTNLRILNLMDNKISRFGSMIGLKKLQRLNISMNQLISTRGLSLVSTLTLLDVSSNNITSLDEMESLALLQCLNAAHNSLQEMPKFTNNVLLRHLDLSHNNLSSVAILSLCWLPLLKTVNISYNNIDSLPVLKATLNLEIFDCSMNKISSLEALTDCLSTLMTLRLLHCDENPCMSVPQARSIIIETLSVLMELNCVPCDQTSRKVPPKQLPDFHKMCQYQNNVLDAVENAIKLCKSHFTANAKNNHLSFIATKSALLDKHHELSVKLREEHEFGEMGNDSELLNAQSLIESNTVKVDVIAPSSMQTDFDRPVSSRKENKVASMDERKNSTTQVKTTRAKIPVGPLKTVEFVREAWKSAVKDSTDVSASKIQALWRGYCVRKKLSTIQAQVEEEINQMLIDEDLQLDDNFDLDNFLSSQNEILLEDWKLGDDEFQEVVRNIATPREAFAPTAALPTVLETERENKAILLQSPGISGRVPNDSVLKPNLGNESEWNYSDIHDVESLHLNGSVSQLEEDKNLNSFSARQAKIAEDWGFKNDTTAQLMLKRAKKMSKTKKFIVTDLPSDRRMTTKSTSHQSGVTKSVSGSSKRSSLVGVGGGGGDHSHRYNERNSTVLQAKLFEAADIKGLDRSEREDFSRVFAWVNKSSSEENQQLLPERPCSVRSGDMLRTGPPKQLQEKVPTFRQSSSNMTSKDTDLDIISVSDGRSQKSERNFEPSLSQRSIDLLNSTGSGNTSGFLNRTKVLPPINGKYVDGDSDRNNSAGWGTGKKVTGKPPKARRTPKK